VDEVMDVSRVNPGDIRQSPEVNRDHSCEDAILGIVQVAGNMVICIDPARLVSECLSVRDLMSSCAAG